MQNENQTGFVSNSSSSSFIVLIPKDLKDFEIKDLTEDCKNNLLEYSEDPDVNEEKIYEDGLEKINSALTELRNGDDVYEQDDDCGAYNCLVELLEPYVIKTLDSGGDGEGYITPADMKTIKKVMK